MTWLAPALLAGLAGLGLPILAHLLGREPPKRVPFAGLRFVSTTPPTVTRRRRLRDPLLLALRMMLLALVVFALARPATRGDAAIAMRAEPHDAVLLLDTTASTRLRTDTDVDERSRVLDRAEALVEALPEGSRVAIATSDARGPTLPLTEDRMRATRVLRGLRDTPPTPHAARLGDRLGIARQLAPGAGARPVVVYAIGDRSLWGLASIATRSAAGAEVILIPSDGRLDVRDVAELPATPEHVGLDDIAWSKATDVDPNAIRIVGTVHRHGGGTTRRRVQVALWSGERELGRGEVELASDEVGTVEFVHGGASKANVPLDGGDTGQADAGSLDSNEEPITLRLHGIADDPLPLDDARHAWVGARDRLQVWVVNGDPRERRTNDETFFFATALTSSAGDVMSVRSLAPEQLEARIQATGAAALAEVDVVVLANVPLPSPKVMEALESRIRGGLGLWITAGDRMDVDAWNAGAGRILPLRMREIVEAGTLPGRTTARGETIAPAVLSHPIFSTLVSPRAEGDAAEGDDALQRGELGISGSKTRKLVLLEPDTRRDADAALAYSSGSPALVTRSVGRGRVALLTTSIDRDWSDLAIRPGFVVLVRNTVAWLGGSDARTTERVGVGEPVLLPLSAPATVHAPDGRTFPVAPGDDGTATFTETSTLGHYWVETSPDRPYEARRFVVSLPAAEFDTRPVVGATTGEDTADRATVGTWSPRWRLLAWLALLLLAIESVARSFVRRSST
jgi:hypothetical protein